MQKVSGIARADLTGGGSLIFTPVRSERHQISYYLEGESIIYTFSLPLHNKNAYAPPGLDQRQHPISDRIGATLGH